jgi:hypothetical protein
VSKEIIVAYLGCGCVVWYADREYLPDERPAADCSRCGKPSSGIRATEMRVVEDGCEAAAPRGVRYWVLVSRELLDTNPPWAAVGLRLVERGGWENGHARWCLVEDPDAPAELEGREVEILITEEDGKPRITGRQVTG